jgi:hypothetical protein
VSEIQFDEGLVKRGIKAAASHNKSQWELGELACEADPGEKGSTLKEYANRIGFPYTTLQNYRQTAVAFPQSKRLDSLTWSHHFATLRVPDEGEREAMLQQAAENRWSVKDLKDEIGERFPREQKQLDKSAILERVRMSIRGWRQQGLSPREIQKILQEVVQEEKDHENDKAA